MSFKKVKRIPNHLAIILDGNGRWAKKRGLARSLGHKEGAKAVKEIVRYAFSEGVYALSLFCFSTENWKRDKEEVDYLMSLPITYFNQYKDKLLNDDVKVIFSGDLSKLPLETKKVCEEVANLTKSCKSHVLNMCINYGGRSEIVRACKLIASDALENKINIDDIDENLFESHLYTNGLPSVDLLIRTSNEKRISNFMLYQISYAEIYFTKTLWPSFTKKSLDKAFIDFAKRDRRFGGVKK